MTSAVLTPFYRSRAVELGNRMWRKKVLPVGDVEYKGRTLHFTLDYLKGLARSFTARAYDQVAFQLADAQNTHTNDPERFRGDFVAMDAEPDGLWVTLKPTEAGDKVLQENPELGVSARIVEDYARSDGKHFPAAIQHVLGTLDPRIPGLGAWQAIEAASPVPDSVLDLTNESFTDLAGNSGKAARKAAKAQRRAAKNDETQADPASDTAGADPEGGAVMADLSDEQKQKLARLLELPDETLDALAAGGTVVTPEELEALTAPGDDEDDDTDGDDIAEQIASMTDDELTALEAEFEAEYGTATEGETPDYVPEGEPVAAGLANDEYEFAINLANAKAEETARELAVVTARLREEDFQGEKRRLADLGVPPYITELAKPLLEGAGHAVELANGKTVDAGAITRQVLTEFARQVKLLDLSAESGSPFDEPDGAGDGESAQYRDDVVTRMKSAMGLK